LKPTFENNRPHFSFKRLLVVSGGFNFGFDADQLHRRTVTDMKHVGMHSAAPVVLSFVQGLVDSARQVIGCRRPIYSFPRRALTLCPQLCMGI
jgi:hypothetical protein